MTSPRTILFALLLSLMLGVAHAQTININNASVTELTSLSGIGSARAQAIVAEREANGPFASPDDLKTRINGIGNAIIDNNRERMSFD